MVQCGKGGGCGTIQMLGGAQVMAAIGPFGGWFKEPPIASLRGCDFGKGACIVKVYIKNDTELPILYDIGVHGGWGIRGDVASVFIEVGETVCYKFSNELGWGFDV